MAQTPEQNRDLFRTEPEIENFAVNLIDLPGKFRELFEHSFRARESAKKYYKTPKEPADKKKAELLISLQRESELDRLLSRFVILPGENCGDPPLILERKINDSPEDWGPDAIVFLEGSQIKMARYNSFENRIEVLFVAGSIYHYFKPKDRINNNVKAIFEAWVTNSDPTKYFMANIRTSLPYKKISP